MKKKQVVNVLFPRVCSFGGKTGAVLKLNFLFSKYNFYIKQFKKVLISLLIKIKVTEAIVKKTIKLY